MKRPYAICFLFLLAAGCAPEQSEEEVKSQAAGIQLLNRNMYVIFDGSGSMNYNCRGDRFDRKIDGAKWAVEEFLKTVPQNVNLGLFVFDNNGMREVVPLALENRAAFLEAVKVIDAAGGTPLADAMKSGTEKLVAQYKKQLGYGEFRLVVVTDGIANGIPQAAQYAIERGIAIHTIGLCIGDDHPLRHWSMSYRAANNSEDLKKALE